MLFQHKTALDTILAWQRENECEDSVFLRVYNNVLELLKEKIPQRGQYNIQKVTGVLAGKFNGSQGENPKVWLQREPVFVCKGIHCSSSLQDKILTALTFVHAECKEIHVNKGEWGQCFGLDPIGITIFISISAIVTFSCLHGI